MFLCYIFSFHLCERVLSTTKISRCLQSWPTCSPSVSIWSRPYTETNKLMTLNGMRIKNTYPASRDVSRDGFDQKKIRKERP